MLDFRMMHDFSVSLVILDMFLFKNTKYQEVKNQFSGSLAPISLRVKLSISLHMENSQNSQQKLVLYW